MILKVLSFVFLSIQIIQLPLKKEKMNCENLCSWKVGNSATRRQSVQLPLSYFRFKKETFFIFEFLPSYRW